MIFSTLLMWKLYNNFSKFKPFYRICRGIRVEHLLLLLFFCFKVSTRVNFGFQPFRFKRAFNPHKMEVFFDFYCSKNLIRYTLSLRLINDPFRLDALWRSLWNSILELFPVSTWRYLYHSLFSKFILVFAFCHVTISV